MPSFKNLSINGKLTLVIMLASSTTLFLATAGYVTYQVGALRAGAVRWRCRSAPGSQPATALGPLTLLLSAGRYQPPTRATS